MIDQHGTGGCQRSGGSANWALLWELGIGLFYFLLTALSAGTLSAVAIYVSIISTFKVCDLRALIDEDTKDDIIWNYHCDDSDLALLGNLTDQYGNKYIVGYRVSDYPIAHEDTHAGDILVYIATFSPLLTDVGFVQVVLRTRFHSMGWPTRREECVVAVMAICWPASYPIYLFCRICRGLLDWGESLLSGKNVVLPDGKIILGSGSSDLREGQDEPPPYRWRKAWRGMILWLKRNTDHPCFARKSNSPA